MSKMEFTIANAILKNAINRVSALVDKKAYIPAFQGVLIKAAENKVAISAVNSNDRDVYATVYINDVTVIKDGAVCITLVDVEKILMIKDIIHIEVNDNFVVSAKNAKKKSKVCGFSDGEFIDIPYVDCCAENLVMTIPDGMKFCEDMQIIGKTKMTSDSRPLFKGFNFNSTNKSICTIDGYQMTIKTVDYWSDNSTNITITGRADGDLTKLIGKNHEPITMYNNGRYAAFIGSDFKYVCGLIDGKFIDWKEIMPTKDALSEFKFADTKTFLDTLKEYDKFNNAKCITPCVIAGYSDYAILTDYRNANYTTTDEVEIKGRIDKDMLIGLNPKYLHTALSLYHKLGIDYTVRAYGRLEPVVITGGDFLSLVVPMRISEGRDKESIVKEYAA